MADSLGRRRLDHALRSVAATRWFNSFVDLREALEIEPRRVLVAVIDMQDPTGAAAHGFARSTAEVHPGIGIVAYRMPRRDSAADICLLGAAGVHDVLIAGVTDEGHLARTIILDASRRGAADLVMTELKKVLPYRLHPFADAAVRNPSKGTIASITQHINVHRQTPNFWCRKERYLRPEELLVWCRLLLVSALLELTSRTLDSIAIELDYASPTSLRNQLKSYTGMTATRIRAVGFAAIMTLFVGRVAQVQGGFSGTAVSEESSETTRPKFSSAVDRR